MRKKCKLPPLKKRPVDGTMPPMGDDECMASMKMLPSNLEAERGILGAMLIRDGESIADVQGRLSPEDFYSDEYRLIYKAMLEIYNDEKSIDVIRLKEYLRKNGELEKAGGAQVLNELDFVVPTNAHIMKHADIVKSKSKLRDLIAIGEEIAGDAYADMESVDTILDRAEQKIFSLSSSEASVSFESAHSIILRVYENINKIYESGNKQLGLSTGLPDLDKMMGGLRKSDFIIIAARPSMGKTALVLNIANNIAKFMSSNDGVPRVRKNVAIFSLEMSREQLGYRLLSLESGINSQKLSTGSLNEAEWLDLQNASERISKAAIYVDDTPALSAIEIRTRARRQKAEYGLDLVIIDYLQLMQGKQGRGEFNRQQEISEISRSLKALARELDIPVIALSQLSRAVEMRAEKKPQLSDLRESGSLEQDADAVLFLYRESYYKQDVENEALTELIVAKHRNGPTGVVNVNFRKETMQFTSIDNYHEQS